MLYPGDREREVSGGWFIMLYPGDREREVSPGCDSLRSTNIRRLSVSMKRC